MRKDEFLSRLQRGIALLEDEEQTDIIDEYAQHIDMQVKEGMTEQEAIEGFGPVDELIEEILGAYHVKPAAAQTSGASDQGKASQHAAQAVRKAGTELKESLGEFVSNAGELLSGASRHGRRSDDNTSADLQNAAPNEQNPLGESSSPSASDASQPNVNTRAQEATRRTHAANATPDEFGSYRAKGAKDAANAAKTLGKTAGAAGEALACACLTALRWVWNALVGCTAALLALAGVICIMVFGFCLVLAIGGYPLAGIVIAALGCSLALLSLAGLCCMLIRRKKGTAPEPEKQPEPSAHCENEASAAAYSPSTASAVTTPNAHAGVPNAHATAAPSLYTDTHPQTFPTPGNANSGNEAMQHA